MRHIRASVAIALLSLLALAAPAAAKPQATQETWFTIWPDVEHQLVVFFNIGRDDFCAWQESDFEGDPPVTRLLDGSFSQTPTGAIVFSVGGTSSLELWRMDPDADLSGPCEDTDGLHELFAAGSATYSYHDNDLDHGFSVFELGLSRSDAFGEAAQARVTDAAGMDWNYSWTLRTVGDKSFDFRDVVPVRAVLSPAG
jgi:hypothetical protein